MKRNLTCPACSRGVYFETEDEFLYEDEQVPDIVYGVASGFCPSCERWLVFSVSGTNGSYMGSHDYKIVDIEEVEEVKVLHPQPTKHFSLPNEVPERYQKDFAEANLILDLSPKASAAISRRILQDVLREKYQIKQRNLAGEIKAFIELPGIPSHITESIDAIREIGNFAAHPNKDTNTGEVIDVEPGEAEWLIEVLQDLFDFAYVQPARASKRRAALEEKRRRLKQSK